VRRFKPEVYVLILDQRLKPAMFGHQKCSERKLYLAQDKIHDRITKWRVSRVHSVILKPVPFTEDIKKGSR
jgi:hypothetical protein